MIKSRLGFRAAAVIFLSLCGFFGCLTSAKTGENRPHVYLAEKTVYFLQPTGYMDKSLDMLQRVNAVFKERNFFMLAWVKADKSALEIVLLNEMGASIGELSYNDNSVSIKSDIFPDGFKPEYIIADFQLCFYNTDLMDKVLIDIGLKMEINGNTRRIFKKNILIYEITAEPGNLKLVNYLRGYEYTLEGDFTGTEIKTEIVND